MVILLLWRFHLFDKKNPDGTPRKILDNKRINDLGWFPKTKLKIGFDAIISFADPSANFGLVLKEIKIEKKIIKKQKKDVKLDRNNVINFSNYKKNWTKV